MTSAAEFERIVTQHQAGVFRTLARLLGTQQHVPDLAQEVFLRLHRALPGFRGDALLTTYLYRITVNVAQDERRRRACQDQKTASISDSQTDWEARLHHPSPNPEQHLLERETHAQLEQAMQQLTDTERTVLVLYHQQECSYLQIAEILRIPVNTVRTHLHRGRNRLRSVLAASTTASKAASKGAAHVARP